MDMKYLKYIFAILLTLAAIDVLGAPSNQPGPYQFNSFEMDNPYEEAAKDDDKKIRRPSSEEEYKFKYELEQRPKWQDIEEHCGDRCIYPDSRGN
ncbi:MULTISPECIES: hypothetical protein [Halobacteriovorax]|uniref:Secreted protein n=2 Tax=Halobacteriovorax TaxID=1652133 RepID=A0ABY0IBK7_9BACT|nr:MULTISPECIES: hypothetical protein [Halobacteriovorax]RZF20368.1 hypothetical protein DAY19_14490 [Halobacteriovorax vibrionivorans]